MTFIPNEAFASDIIIAIYQNDSASDIENKIKKALISSTKPSTVTVLGSKTDVNATLHIFIPRSKSLIWQATYVSPNKLGNHLIELDGDYGNFHIQKGGIITSNGDNTIHAEFVNIFLNGGSVKANGDNCTAIESYVGDLTMQSGLIKATGTGCCAIKRTLNVLTISGGKIEVTGTGCNAIYTEEGSIVNISGATIQATGTSACAIRSYDYWFINNISGGNIIASGEGACSLIINTGAFAITGGKISAVGNKSSAIAIMDNGVCAYLYGTCIGNKYVTGNKGMIVEVDSTKILSDRTGSSGIKTVAGSGSAKWDMNQDRPIINFALSDGSLKSIQWGDKDYRVKKVSVYPVLYLAKGKTTTLPIIIQPFETKNRKVSWKSSKPKIAKVNSKTGKIKGLKTGKAIVTVKTDDGKKTAKCTVHVVKKEKKLKAFKVSYPKNKKMKVGQTYRLKVQLIPKKATGVVPSYYSHQVPDVTIDATGIIHAHKKCSADFGIHVGKQQKYIIIDVE